MRGALGREEREEPIRWCKGSIDGRKKVCFLTSSIILGVISLRGQLLASSEIGFNHASLISPWPRRPGQQPFFSEQSKEQKKRERRGRRRRTETTNGKNETQSHCFDSARKARFLCLSSYLPLLLLSSRASFQRSMNSSTLLASPARTACAAQQQRKGAVRATSNRSAMRPTAACGVAAALAAPPALSSSSSIDRRLRLEKVRIAPVGAFHFSPFYEHAILCERFYRLRVSDPQSLARFLCGGGSTRN